MTPSRSAPRHIWRHGRPSGYTSFLFALLPCFSLWGRASAPTGCSPRVSGRLLSRRLGTLIGELQVMSLCLNRSGQCSLIRHLKLYFILHTCTHKHSHIHTHTLTYTLTHTYTHTHIYTHTLTHMHSHIDTNTHMHTHILTHTYSYIYTHAHTHTQRLIHTYTHTHTHTHIYTPQAT